MTEPTGPAHVSHGPDLFTIESVLAGHAAAPGRGPGSTDGEPGPDASGAGRLAAFVETLRQPALADELAQRDAVVGAMTTVLSGQSSSNTTEKVGKRMLGKVLTAKVAAIAAGAVLMGGVAAAATGTLPTAVEDLLPGGSEVTEVTTDTTDTTATTDTSASTVPNEDATDATDATDTTLGTGDGADDPADSPGDGGTTTTLLETPAATTVPSGDTVPCVEGNHGATVSSVAKSHEGEGREAGEAVSAAAHSDCGRDHDDADDPDDDGDDHGTGHHDEATDEDRNSGTGHGTNGAAASNDGASHKGSSASDGNHSADSDSADSDSADDDGEDSHGARSSGQPSSSHGASAQPSSKSGRSGGPGH